LKALDGHLPPQSGVFLPKKGQIYLFLIVSDTFALTLYGGLYSLLLTQRRKDAKGKRERNCGDSCQRCVCEMRIYVVKRNNI